MKWMYGITTVPSRRSTLEHTIKSLILGGFGDPWLFVDGCIHPHEYYDLVTNVSPRTEPIGAYGNWILGMVELYLRNPEADRYAMFQDDIECVRNLRQYLTVAPYPANGYLNLHLMRDNEELAKPGVSGFVEATYWKPTRQTGRGAQALIFNNKALRTLLQHPHILDRCQQVSAVRRKVLIDGSACEAMNASGYKEYVHVPSLVQHVGVPSTLEVKLTQPPAKTYPGNEFDALTLLTRSNRC